MLFGFLGMTYEFKWSVLWAQPHLTWLIDGLLTTLRLASISWCIAILLGIIFGAMHGPLPAGPGHRHLLRRVLP